MYGSMYNSSGLPVLSAGATIEPSIFGDFPADGQDQLPDPVLSSDSSAEDDLTLGPDPDSADHGPSSGIPFSHHAPMGHQHNSQHQPSHIMSNMMSHGQVHHTLGPGGYGPPSSSVLHMGQHHSQHGLNGGGMNGNGGMGSASRVQLMMDPQYHSYAAHMQANYGHASSQMMQDLPSPTMRQKRPSMDQGAGRPFAPQSPHGPSQNSLSYSNSSPPSSSPTTPSRRRSSTRGSIDSSASGNGSPGTPGGDGYFYRSRDKTNYQQAHKGVIPNPPSTPEGSKRIRCTWTLEETRHLFDILKDATVDLFPDAHVVRSALLKVDPQSNKTLDHVRNKKANLIQKAHSRSCSVAEVLIADMNKLENESTGSTRNTAALALAHSRDREMALLTSNNAIHSTSSSPSLSTATSMSGSSSASATMKFENSRPISVNLMGDSEIKVGATTAAPTSANSTSSRSKVPAAGRARRRGAKRSATNSYAGATVPAPTSTAQQLANLSSANRASLDMGLSYSAGGGSITTSMTSLVSENTRASIDSTASGSSFMQSDGSHTPRVTLTTGPPPISTATDTGGISIGRLPLSEITDHHRAAHTSLSTLLTPPVNSDLSIEHTASIAKSIAQEHSAAVITATFANAAAGGDGSSSPRYQQWIQECLKKLFDSANEIRAQLNLPAIQMPTPPESNTPRAPGSITSLPRSEQWISSWNPTGSPVPSLLSPTPPNSSISVSSPPVNGISAGTSVASPISIQNGQMKSPNTSSFSGAPTSITSPDASNVQAKGAEDDNVHPIASPFPEKAVSPYEALETRHV